MIFPPGWSEHVKRLLLRACSSDFIRKSNEQQARVSSGEAEKHNISIFENNAAKTITNIDNVCYDTQTFRVLGAGNR
jgi:hypothetical protein